MANVSERPSFPARLPSNGTGARNPRSMSSGPAIPHSPAASAPATTLATGAGRPVGAEPDCTAVRAHMVRKIEAQGVRSTAVLQSLGAVERHRFVDSALRAQAYEDTSLPIGLGQTISKPGVVARMCELLLGAEIARGGPLGRVLEIGTGCGYQAAVLALMAREVYSIERLRGLHEKARANLRPFRIANVHLLFGDGMVGYAKGAPYTGIIAAAGGEAIPDAWCEQLAVGGRLVAPMATRAGRQTLIVMDRTSQGMRQTVLEDVHFVPLKSGIA